MAKYKPDQGNYARTTALLLLGAMAAFGAYTLYYFLLSFRGEDSDPGFLVRDLSGGRVPVLGIPLTPALAIAAAVGGAAIWAIHSALNRPKVADVLIECETEMRKCTWPSPRETITSSVVILVVMLFFTAVLAGMDLVLNYVMSKQVFG
jgi:preprotein translocase SecE subunit